MGWTFKALEFKNKCSDWVLCPCAESPPRPSTRPPFTSLAAYNTPPSPPPYTPSHTTPPYTQLRPPTPASWSPPRPAVAAVSRPADDFYPGYRPSQLGRDRTLKMIAMAKTTTTFHNVFKWVFYMFVVFIMLKKVKNILLVNLEICL
jgi:hypothetical protein